VDICYNAVKLRKVKKKQQGYGLQTSQFVKYQRKKQRVSEFNRMHSRRPYEFESPYPLSQSEYGPPFVPEAPNQNICHIKIEKCNIQ
jgi:hypothetical protein